MKSFQLKKLFFFRWMEYFISFKTSFSILTMFQELGFCWDHRNEPDRRTISDLNSYSSEGKKLKISGQIFMNCNIKGGSFFKTPQVEKVYLESGYWRGGWGGGCFQTVEHRGIKPWGGEGFIWKNWEWGGGASDNEQRVNGMRWDWSDSMRLRDWIMLDLSAGISNVCFVLGVMWSLCMINQCSHIAQLPY